jgi:hypothetical protein
VENLILKVNKPFYLSYKKGTLKECILDTKFHLLVLLEIDISFLRIANYFLQAEKH